MSPASSSPKAEGHAAAGPPTANLTIVVGTLSSPPRVRELPSGTVLASLELTIAGTPRESVPVTVFDPSARVIDLIEGESVLIVGRVRRRFYRAGAVTQSRTEVVADRVTRTRARRSVGAALGAANERLGEITEAIT